MLLLLLCNHLEHMQGLSTGVTEELVDVSGGDDFSLAAATQRKLDAVGKLLDKSRAARVIIFCNKLETCREVENFVGRKDKQAERWQPLAVHKAVTPENREANLAAFLYPPQPGQPARVLICTDRCDWVTCPLA